MVTGCEQFANDALTSLSSTVLSTAGCACVGRYQARFRATLDEETGEYVTTTISIQRSIPICRCSGVISFPVE